MNTISRAIAGCFVALLIVIPQNVTFAADGSITILEPKEGTDLASGSGNKLKYDVKLSPSGSHLHVYVDDQPPIIVREVKMCPCSVELPKLSAGKHKIIIKEATSGHSLTGVESSVTVSVK
ncbi:MAG: hypothetical protein HY272_09120 [Gammaproteobacteria bacterium]|nr:hypothetical protein [Gammaproteobacteria bacterium]